jgi:hypothetical protein
MIINHPQSTRFCRRILEQIINQQGAEHCLDATDNDLHMIGMLIPQSKG